MLLQIGPTFKYTKTKPCAPSSYWARNSNFFETLINNKQIRIIILNRYVALFYWDFYSVYIAANYIMLSYWPITLYSCVLAQKGYCNTWLPDFLKIRLNSLTLCSWPDLSKTLSASCSDLVILYLPSAIALKQLWVTADRRRVSPSPAMWLHHLLCQTENRNTDRKTSPRPHLAVVELPAGLSFPLEREHHLCSFGS